MPGERQSSRQGASFIPVPNFGHFADVQGHRADCKIAKTERNRLQLILQEQQLEVTDSEAKERRIGIDEGYKRYPGDSTVVSRIVSRKVKGVPGCHRFQNAAGNLI